MHLLHIQLLSFFQKHRCKYLPSYYQQDFKIKTILKIDFDRLKEILDCSKTDEQNAYSVEPDLKNAFREGGVPQLRWRMNGIIMNLHYIVLSDELGRNATYDEWVNSMESYKVGIARKDMPSYFLDGLDQFELGKMEPDNNA